MATGVSKLVELREPEPARGREDDGGDGTDAAEDDPRPRGICEIDSGG